MTERNKLIKKYIEEIRHGKLYKGRFDKHVIWMETHDDTFTAYQFICYKTDKKIDKEKPDSRKYCVTNHIHELSCYKVECPKDDLVITVNPKLEINREFGVADNYHEILIEYPKATKKEIDINDVPNEILDNLNEWIYNLQVIGFAEHFDKNDVVKVQ